MNVPVVAIIGRPNVGKSELFNRIIGEHTAIVSEEAGTTRDRNFAKAEWAGHAFWLVDTGGINDDQRAPMDVEIRRQVDHAIGEADLLLFVVDAKGRPASGRPSRRRAAAQVRQAVAARRQQGRRSEGHVVLRVLQPRRRRSGAGVGDQRQGVGRPARRRDRQAARRSRRAGVGDAHRRHRQAERRQVVVRQPAARRRAAGRVRDRRARRATRSTRR